MSPVILSYRIKGFSSVQQVHKAQQALSKAEKETIISWIQRCQTQRFPPYHDILKTMAEYIIAKWNNTNRRDTLFVQVLSYNWAGRFVARHVHFQLVMSRPIEQSWNKACTKETFER